MWKTADLHLGLIPKVLTEMRAIQQTRDWNLQWDILELSNPSWSKGNSGVMHFGHTGLFKHQDTDRSQEAEEILSTYGRFPLTKHKPCHPKNICTSSASLAFPS